MRARHFQLVFCAVALAAGYGGSALAWTPPVPATGASLEVREGESLSIRWKPAAIRFTAERAPGAFGQSRAKLLVPGLVPASTLKDCGLIDGQTKDRIEVAPDGAIDLEVNISGVGVEHEIQCVNRFGAIRRERIRLSFAGYEAALLSALPARGPSRTYQLGLATTWIDYGDEGSGLRSEFKSLSTTLTGGVTQWVVARKWLLAASGYLTLFPITRSGSASSATVRFLGLNARAGFRVPQIPEPWALTVMGGVYYATSFVSTNEFGFTGVQGPQFYPVVRYALKGGDQVTAYFKFSPVGSSWGVLNPSNRELASGASYVFSKTGWSIHFDASELQLSFTSPERYEMSSKTFSLGLARFF